MGLQLREYQKELAGKAVQVLSKHGIVYLSMAVRTGKTSTSLEIARLGGFRKVLFLTKKKAISSILEDYSNFGFKYSIELDVLNDESMHKVDLSKHYDLIIHDEHHRFGAFPKPSQGAKLFRESFKDVPMIFLSGTPSPESYSQMYHQFWVSSKSPFKEWSNFYKWSKDFVNVKDRHLGYAVVKDYSDADRNKVMKYISHLMISFSQHDAGFKTEIVENVLYCPINDKTLTLIKRLQKDKVIEGKEEVILADTAVKLMQKVHQMYSGTVKFESGNAKVLDTSKAEFIKTYFRGQKIAIFYKFKAELEALKMVFGDLLTDDLSEFDNSNKSFAVQIVSGREGISLRKAQYLIYYNIDFSATSYWQSRDRLTTMDRMTNEVFWIFTRGGIEENIYKTVQNKADYTLSHFNKDFNHGIKVSRENNTRVTTEGFSRR
jgi:hypothetical protein